MKYKYMKTSKDNIAVEMNPHVDRELRNKIFLEKLGIKPTIVSHDYWDHLACTYPIQILQVSLSDE